jgi:hypothetical protein
MGVLIMIVEKNPKIAMLLSVKMLQQSMILANVQIATIPF